MAEPALDKVQAPTLSIVGGRDVQVLTLNRQALAQLETEKQLEVVPGAGHLFEEPGALDDVARLARANGSSATSRHKEGNLVHRRIHMYESIEELPDTVRDVLPPEAQEAYLEGFNASWESYDEEKTSEMTQEAVANRDAWAAVKRQFTEDPETGKWYPAGEVPEHVEERGEEEEEGLFDILG